MYSCTYVSAFCWYRQATGESELPNTQKAFRFLLGFIDSYIFMIGKNALSLCFRTQTAQLLGLFFFLTTGWPMCKVKSLNTSGNNLTEWQYAWAPTMGFLYHWVILSLQKAPWNRHDYVPIWHTGNLRQREITLPATVTQTAVEQEPKPRWPDFRSSAPLWRAKRGAKGQNPVKSLQCVMFWLAPSNHSPVLLVLLMVPN